MGTWTDRIRNHPVWAQLEAIGSLLDQSIVREDITPEWVEATTRLKSVFSFAGRRLAASDSFLITQAALDQLNNATANSATEVQNYIANGNTGHLMNANTHADLVLNIVAGIVSPAIPEELNGLREASDDYRKRIEGVVTLTSQLVHQTAAELERLRERLSALSSDIQSEKQRLATLSTEYQLQFSNAQELRSKEFNDTQTERALAFGNLNSTSEAAYKQLSANFQKMAEDNLISMKDKLKEVESLTGVIGNLAVTSGYQKDANEAKWVSRLWQFVAVGSLGGLVYLAYKAFLPLVQGDFSWASFAGRVFVSLTIGLLAGYAMRQADKLQQVERQSRKLALELEAIGPFVQPLTDDKKQDFRIKIGERTFGNVEISTALSSGEKKPLAHLSNTKDLTYLITEIVKTIVKDKQA